MPDTVSRPFHIYLVRHANAAWPEPGCRDFDRRLDPRGREEAAQLAEMMADAGFHPGHVVCSPAARCRETLVILKSTLAADAEIEFHQPLYSESHDAYLDAIARHAEGATGSLMIVGHNPMMEETARALLDKSATPLSEVLPRGFPTAALLAVEHISAEEPATSGHGRLLALLSPDDA